MPLPSGTRLGPYEITVPLGAGGMGQVYRAKDTKLGRDVAIKVLSDTFTQDPERMARFEREARVLASLNHPNIASIYGIEDSANLRALVLELVQGPTLADRIKRGAIPVDDALRIAGQIAEALEYAHERGIVHRDLKPANVGLTDGDAVKVLDFGLAKAIAEENVRVDISASPTISHMSTQVGIILGTAAYMSPEQAKGRAVDRRADIWAFGCVLLEMLTGRMAFGAETLTDTLAAVVLREPDWAQLPVSTPGVIRDLLQRCLKKDVRQRLQAIGDARITIEESLAGTIKEEQPPILQPRSRFPWWSIFPGTILALVVLASGWFYLLRPSPPQTTTLTADLFAGTDIHDPAISPDGKVVAFEHDGKLWLRSMDELEPKILTGTEDGQNPFWSPDSKSIAYFHNGELRRVPAHGGPSTLICQLVPDRQMPPATWGADDRIVFQDIPNGFFEVSAKGGTPRLFTKPDRSKDEAILRDPHFLADGQTLVMVIRRPGPGLQLDTIAVQSGSKRSVVLQIPDARILNVVSSERTGHLLFFVVSQPNPGVWAVPFSFSNLKTTDKPFLVRANAVAPSVSSHGDLVYLSNILERSQELRWVDRSGNPLGTFGTPKNDMRDPVISPDGTKVALESAGAKWEIWVQDSIRNTATHLAGTLYGVGFPEWLDHGKSIAFGCQISLTSEANVCVSPADGSGQPQSVLNFGPGVGASFSPDQRTILFAKENEGRNFDIWSAPFQTGAKPEPFIATQFNELAPRISPDGRYVAYQSDESGRYEIYVRPFPTGEGRWTVSTNGGTTPKWSSRGDELFYLQSDMLMAVSARSNPAFNAGLPHPLFSGKKVGSTMLLFDAPLWDVAPDGRRFIVIRNAETGQRSIIADQEWLARIEK